MHRAMVKDMCHDFIWRLNSLSANFGFCNISTTHQLFMSYSISVYGVRLWNLQDKYTDEFLYDMPQGYEETFLSTWLNSL